MARTYRFQILGIKRTDDCQGDHTVVDVQILDLPFREMTSRKVYIDGHPDGAALEAAVRAKIGALAKELDRTICERQLTGRIIEIEVDG